ncbi:BgTH12-00604 [Blumeria graminis f. sp. triticale]|uniref:Bgt-3012 n=3 Tax=Blumeria graminis TaxID=34373 RepID=A0A061HDA8_BLUGR|nr:hypothetical protein BGT96224_3012 [Blumeria graminis f. sp. tritici 96224]CAD6505108.1 BgTH12-00604 [Blumeria graminis f. sp. triticale]VDB93115.1 Bgt-3012 [Blumeria graminis f. sp. tritici]
MVMATIANIPRISSTRLAELILLETQKSPNLDETTPPTHVAVVDVRDSDHIGGHIRYSFHEPSNTLDYRMQELVYRLESRKIVVFHCALSQERGPAAALRYLRERERLMDIPSNQETSTRVSMETLCNEVRESSFEENRRQLVFILDEGFVGWQKEYGEDSRLTEGFRKDLWRV